jgi:hypothetical protein
MVPVIDPLHMVSAQAVLPATKAANETLESNPHLLR